MTYLHQGITYNSLADLVEHLENEWFLVTDYEEEETTTE